MSRRFEPRHDKVKNTAAVAPVMPADPRPKPDQIVKKIYIQQQPRSGEFYGVPKLALWIIVVNCAVWLCGGVSLLVGRASVIDILGVALFGVAGIVIWLAIHFALWKMYWWLLALSVSLASLMFVWVYVAVVTGSAMMPEIRFPRINF
jgi:hypothetical protein